MTRPRHGKGADCFQLSLQVSSCSPLGTFDAFLFPFRPLISLPRPDLLSFSLPFSPSPPGPLSPSRAGRHAPAVTRVSTQTPRTLLRPSAPPPTSRRFTRRLYSPEEASASFPRRPTDSGRARTTPESGLFQRSSPESRLPTRAICPIGRESEGSITGKLKQPIFPGGIKLRGLIHKKK